MKREPILDENQSSELELRVLYGPQAGSRLPLAAGNYLLGNSDECTIILNGPRIEAEHALIDFDDALPSITPRDGTVCDAQGNAILDRFPMSLGMPIEIGGAWISIDYLAAPWPDPAAVAPINPGSPMMVPDIATESDLSDRGDGTRAVSSQAENFHRHARKALIMSAITLLALLVSGGGLAGWYIYEQTTLETAQAENIDLLPTEPNYVGDLRKNLEKIIGNDTIKVSFSAQDGVVITGYVKTTALKSRIGGLLVNYVPAPTVNVFSEEEMLALANKMLTENMSSNRAKLIVENINGGTLKVAGAVTIPSVRDEMVDLLKNGVPGITQVDAMVVTAEDLPQRLEEEISNAGLRKRFQVMARQPEFILRGKLTETEFRNWEKVLLSFVDTYGSVLPIRASIGVVETKPPVNVEAIVGGAAPFIITKSGQRIERGGNINGNVLTIVRDNEIIFDGNERYRIGR